VSPRHVRLAEAPSFGKPIILYDLASVGAQAYVDLAKELLERHQKPISKPISDLVPFGDAPPLAAAAPVAASAAAPVAASAAAPASTDASDNPPLGNHHEHGETPATR
jgi:hypothetical protein